MRFEVRQVSAGPRNCVGEVFCDGARIATVNCTIGELAEMRRRLEDPRDAILMPVGTQH